MINLVNFARIGKRLIRRMTGVQENYKKIEYIEELDYTPCQNCELNKLSCENNQYCTEYCQKIRVKKEKVTYVNEANSFKIPSDERLSKSQLKQILLYHFLGIDENGILRNISISEIANILDCDEKTVKNNNKRLSELNYILHSKASSDTFSIMLVDYKNYHLRKNEGGTGYVNMTRDLFLELLNVKNVNALRIELRELIKFDDSNIGVETIEQGTYSMNDVKRFLPQYVRYEKAIKECLENGSGAFDVKLNKKELTFKLKDEYNPKILREKIFTDFEYAFDSYYEVFNFTNNEVESLYSLCLQYGIDVVQDTLDIIYKDYVLKGIYIRNLGGLIRMQIRMAA